MLSIGEGYRTYIIAAVAAALAAANALGYPVPEYIYQALIALGLYTGRNATAKIS